MDRQVDNTEEREKKERILITDDEADARELLRIALASQDYELEFAENGEQAKAKYKDFAPDLVILDLQLPDSSGIEICSWIKANSPDKFTPVLLVTSQSEVETKVEGFSSGADDYVTKPFSFQELSARVASMLRIKALTNELKQTQNLLAEREKQLVAVQVAGAAAHQLGQPLTSILLNCELLKAQLKNHPEIKSEDVDKTIAAINSEASRVKSTLEQLASVKEYKLAAYTSDTDILDLDQSGDK